MAVNTLLFIVLHAYILRHLLTPELADAQEPHVRLRLPEEAVADVLVLQAKKAYARFPRD